MIPLLALLACGGEAELPPAVTINEIVALNRTGLTDEAGEHEDWIELYNPGEEEVDLSGWTLQDDAGAGEPWTLPAGTVLGAGAFTVLFCDGEVDQGALHASFQLDSNGESLLLFDADGAFVEETRYAILEPDTPWARVPDGSALWQSPEEPSPGESNG